MQSMVCFFVFMESGVGGGMGSGGGGGGGGSSCCFETLNQVTCRTSNGKNSQGRAVKLPVTISGFGFDVITK